MWYCYIATCIVTRHTHVSIKYLYNYTTVLHVRGMYVHVSTCMQQFIVDWVGAKYSHAVTNYNFYQYTCNLDVRTYVMKRIFIYRKKVPLTHCCRYLLSSVSQYFCCPLNIHMAEYFELGHTATKPEMMNKEPKQSLQMLLTSFFKYISHEKEGLLVTWKWSRVNCWTPIDYGQTKDFFSI